MMSNDQDGLFASLIGSIHFDEGGGNAGSSEAGSGEKQYANAASAQSRFSADDGAKWGGAAG
jgi:hypothetical protein